MSFYSREFLFLFLPLTVAAYHLLAQRDLRRAKYFLIAASFFAFSWQAPLNLAAFVPSVAVNWLLGRALLRRAGRRRGLLALGVGLNVALLAAVKYLPVYAAAALGRPAAHTGFAWMLGMLGISFYTFQQISWLRDCAAGRVERPDFRDYLLFLCFFPKFYSGPIVYYGETAEQFATAPGPDWEAMGRGLFLLCLGLAKKVLVADALAGYAAGAFDQSVRLPFLDAWPGAWACSSASGCSKTSTPPTGPPPSATSGGAGTSPWAASSATTSTSPWAAAACPWAGGCSTCSWSSPSSACGTERGSTS
jgi:D-alanyl-lipoteichoic acid acyltransferase DltB (MBOAT superfamily)